MANRRTGSLAMKSTRGWLHRWNNSRTWLLCYLAVIRTCLEGRSWNGILAVSAFSPPVLTLSSTAPTKVLVTGASGRTGQLVLELLLDDPRFDPKALVRSEKSALKLRKAVPGIGIDQIIICDVTTLKRNDPPPGLKGIPKVVICTSAVPIVSKQSLLKAILKAPLNILMGKRAIDFRSFRFRWQAGQSPELVDYRGQVNQIDLAKESGANHIVLVSSMGGTDPSNFLNSVGKNPDGSGEGDILLWKRKAERYLVESGLDYTIIHPGGLIDEPGGKELFVFDVDDKLLQQKKRTISRADVASLCVAALAKGGGRKLAFDCITQPLLESGSNKILSAQEAFDLLLETVKEYNYAD